MMAEIKERKSRLLGTGDIDVSFEFSTEDREDGRAVVGGHFAASPARA